MNTYFEVNCIAKEAENKIINILLQEIKNKNWGDIEGLSINKWQTGKGEHVFDIAYYGYTLAVAIMGNPTSKAISYQLECKLKNNIYFMSYQKAELL